MADSNTLLYTIQVDDKGTPVIKKFGGQLEATSKSSGLMSKAMGDLKGRAEAMGIPIQGVEKYMGGAGAAAVGFGAAALGAAAGIGALTLHAVKVGADLQDMADTTGISVEQLSSMRNVLAASNMDVAGYADAMGKLNLKLVENSKYFKAQGIDIKDSGKAFEQIKHKIGDLEDPLKRTELANKAFGKSYKDLMPLLTMANGEYDKMKDGTSIMSSAFAANAAKVDDQLALLKTKFSDFGVALGTNFIPMMESLVGLLSDAADYWGSMGNGPSQDQINADARDAIHNKYKDLQAEADKGAKLLGVKPTAVKIDGKTEFQAQQEYTAQLQKTRKVAEETAALAQKEAGQRTKAAEQAERQARAAAAAKAFAEAHSYEGYVAAQEKASLAYTKDADNARRYEDANAVNVDYWGGDPKNDPFGLKDGEMRDAQGKWNDEQQTKFNKARYQEHVLDTQGQEANVKAGQEAFDQQQIIDSSEARTAQEAETKKILEEQLVIYEKIGGMIGGLVTGPLTDFYKHIGSGNRSLGASFSALWSDVQDGFGDMLAQMLAEYTKKAIIFAGLNILSGGGVGGATKALESFSWHASGSEYAYGGPTIVGERGPEAVYLPRGSKVVPNEQISKSSTSTQTITINNYDSKMSDRDLARALKRQTDEYGVYA